MPEDRAKTVRDNFEHKYAFVEQVGRGAYGTAWLAIDRQSKEKVLVKTISKACSKRSRFKKELKYAVYLSSHENVITTYPPAYETESHFILVSEYGSGGDLFKAIRPDVGMSQVLARRYVSQLASALSYMHSRRLVHRDVKPENVVLVPTANGTEFTAKLIDFGMTRREGTTCPRIPDLSPYTAPELCSARRGYVVSRSLDSWALGITLFCMLCGSFPWAHAVEEDEDFSEFIEWQSGSRTSVPHQWRSFSPQLMVLFKALLSVEPTARCAVDDLHKFVQLAWFRNSLDDNSENQTALEETAISGDRPKVSVTLPNCACADKEPKERSTTNERLSAMTIELQPCVRCRTR